MGLGKKLASTNATTDAQLQHSKTHVSEGGYNASNIPVLPTAPAMTPGDLLEVSKLSSEARQDYRGKEVNSFGLVKPSVPTGSEYPNPDISALVVEKMWRIVCQKKLHAFYTQGQLQEYVNRACKHDYRILMRVWELPTIDMAVDIAVLGLYDIVLFVDDSGSMDYVEPSEGMKRFDLMREVMKTVAFWATLMDPDGVVVRFFNSNAEGNGLSSIKDVDDLLKTVVPDGMTPLGEQLENKILNKIVLPLMIKSELNRPVLTITLTDGEPSNKQAVIDTIVKCRDASMKSKYGEHAMSFGFAQIGEERAATKYLNYIDTHPVVGKLIDCTSSFNIEWEECGRNPAFTVGAYMVKLLIGSVDESYDSLDE